MPVNDDATVEELQAALAARNGNKQRPIREQLQRGRIRAKEKGGYRFFFMLEGSGLVLALLIVGYQWIYPWKAIDSIGAFIGIFLFGGLINWYNDAHRRAVLEGSEDADIGNDEQAGKDNLFSFFPLLGLGFNYLVSGFGLLLKYNFHAFDGPGFWSRFFEERMIIGWDFIGLSVIVIWMVIGDLVSNSKLFTRLTRRGGLQVRNEN